jgi:hypothetical protein
LEQFGFFVVDGTKIPAGGRLHGKQCDDLETMVLNHITQTAGGFEFASGSKITAERLLDNDARVFAQLTAGYGWT